MAFPTNANQVQAFAGAMYGIQVGSVTMAQVNSDIAAVGSLTGALNAYYAYSFGTKTTDFVAATVAANLGLTGDALTEGTAYIKAQLNAAAPGARGAVIANILSLFAGMSSDATFGAAATAWNAKVDSAALYTASSDVAIGSVVASSGSVFTLTTGTNNFTGTTGDDTFDAGLSTSSLQTLNSGDQIDGGTGTDELYAVISGSVTPSKLTSVENITATVVTSASTLDLSNSTGVSNVVLAGSTFGATLSGVSKSVGITLRDSALGHTITYNDVTGSADSATVNVSNLSQTTGLVTSILGIETLTLNATSSASSTTTTGIGTLTATQATSLKITGDKALRIVDDLASTILSVDASANTGGVAVILDANAATVTGSSGNDTLEVDGTGSMSITAGAGNDTVTFDSTTSDFTTADTAAGGDGTDTLGADAADIVTATSSTPTTYRVSGFEKLDLLTALTDAASINVANLDTSITTIEVSVISAANAAGNETYIFNAGSSTLELDAVISGDGTQAVSVGGSATTDTLTIKNGTTSATNVLAGLALTSTGFETLTINTTGTGAAGAQTVGAVTATASTGATPSIVITGSNALTTGVITAASGSVNASGMSVSVGSTGLDMVTGQNSAVTITGSAGDDDLWGAITTATSQTIAGGAGNDSITAGSGNDTLTGDDNNDVIDGGAGNDNINGGAGNDRVIISADANLTADDTIVGGDGTDTLSLTADMTDDAGTFSRISGFERIRHSAADTITLSNFINNQDFTRIEVNGAVAIAFNNASSNVTTLQLNATGSSPTVDRLVDNSANSITVQIESGDGALTAAALVLQDEETITFSNTLSTDDLTVTALTSTDATSVVVTGAGDLISATAVTSGTKIATVNASASTGAVTFNAGNSAVVVTATAGTGIFTFTGGLLGDAITGGTAADVLNGGTGKDTISGGTGADAITGGIGADSMTGGSGVDTYTQSLTSSVAASGTSVAGTTLAAGDTITFANGVDVISDFTATATGDVLENSAAVVAAIATGIGQNVTTGFATATTTYFVSGSWVAASSQFIVLADGTGADTLIVLGDATPTTLAAKASMVVLVGVDTDNLVAANFS